MEPSVVKGPGSPKGLRYVSQLPMARPAMKLAHTVLAGYTVTPNTHPIMRNHRTW